MALLLPASFALGIAATVAVQRLLNSRRSAPSSDESKAPPSPEQPSQPDSLRYVHPPHPAWTPGTKQPPPFPPGQAMLPMDPSVMDVGSFYSLMISAVVPRPIAFISSMDTKGTFNLAPYSYFNVMGHNPPILAMGICRHGGRPAVDGEPAKKDTLANIEETGEFVVNIISDWFIEAANYTCGDFDHGINEMELAGLTPVPSSKVKPPRVGESAVQFECKLRQVVNFAGKNGQQALSVVLGEVVMCHVHPEVTERSPTGTGDKGQGKVVVDPVKLRPMARLGGVVYARIAELFELPRPNKDGSLPATKTKAQLQDEQKGQQNGLGATETQTQQR